MHLMFYNLTDVNYIFIFIRPMNLAMIRLEGHLIEHTKVVLQITLTSPEIVYTSGPIEWRHNHNCASSGAKKSSGAPTTSTSTSATSTSSSTDSHLHQPISSENSSTVSASSTCGYYSTTNHLSIELEDQLQDLLEDENLYKEASKIAGDYVQHHSGATQTIMLYIQANRLLTN